MSETPHIRYTLPDGREIDPETDGIRVEPIPLTRGALLSSRVPASGIAVSYGDYFAAVRDTVSANRFQWLRQAAAAMLNRPVPTADIREVSVGLAKHGAFYHPAKIGVRIGKQRLELVLNVAVSSAGCETIEREYRLLKRLRSQYEADFIPEVYGYSAAGVRAGRELPMFLGQWFDGFHEFHHAPDPADGSLKPMLWDTETGSRFLTPGQAKDLFRRAAMILTSYYNPETFQQILSWHHAAGDFIVKPLDDRTVDVKLVTVRRYAPAVEMAGPEPSAAVDALLIFILGLSIRNRLDRIEGTGDPVWADDAAVAGTVAGFFQGLDSKVCSGELPDDFPGLFGTYILKYPESELRYLATAVADRQTAESAERALIRSGLNRHLAIFRECLETTAV